MAKGLEKLARWYARDGGGLSRFHRLVLWAKLLEPPHVDATEVARWLSLTTSDVDRELIAGLLREGRSLVRRSVLDELERFVEQETFDVERNTPLERAIYDFHDSASFEMTLADWRKSL